MPNGPLLDFRIEKTLQIIAANPAKTVPELARLMNLSTSRLRHLFRQHTGSSLSSFLLNRRLEQAAELLLNQNLLIKEITSTVGYGHEPSFVRAFSRRYGCSPTSYRRQQQARLLNSRVS
jgi:AraC family transcriptional regulator, arabinose operon regulatory protein